MQIDSIQSIKAFAKYFDLMNISIDISPIIYQPAKNRLQQNLKECEAILMNEVAKDVEVNDPVIVS
ncbi:hypothetical protein [Flavobacterium sp. J27]|uniref:hypothetical protein n=1 Tax=Flavobacterium sp. J27 TaxID=2060419 RepID=UPI001030BAFA|nr:hypothetical protein [Flavobacterium sp. J27]